MNLIKLIKPILIVCLIAIALTSSAQDDFEDKENRKLIKDFKIKEIKSYLYPEGGNPGDSILVSYSFYNPDGLCVKEITPDYTNYFEYNAQGLITKEISAKKGKTGQSIIIFNYDERSNLVLSERVQEGYEDPGNYIFFKHQLSYDAENRLVKDEWIDKSGKAQIRERFEYLGNEPDSGVIEIIKQYDEHDNARYLKKKYDNGRVVMYDINNSQISVRYEILLDESKRFKTVINNRHMGPNASDAILTDGHGPIIFSKVNELYRYNKYGLIAEKLTYQNGKVIEKQTWHYIL